MLRSAALGGQRHEFTEILGPQIHVALELGPRLVERELRDLMDLIAALE